MKKKKKEKRTLTRTPWTLKWKGISIGLVYVILSKKKLVKQTFSIMGSQTSVPTLAVDTSRTFTGNFKPPKKESFLPPKNAWMVHSFS